MSVGNRLKVARERAGFRSARAAALSNGWAESTYRAHENDTRTVSVSEAKKYARRFGVSHIWLLHGETVPKIAEIAPESSRLHVIGQARAGAWMEADGDLINRGNTIPIAPDPRYRHASQYALEVVGDSMNKVVANGEFVVCARFSELGREPRDGDLVVVERHRNGLVEVTLKRYRQTPNGPELLPESNNPAHVRIRMTDQPQGTEVSVSALVIGRYEPL